MNSIKTKLLLWFGAPVLAALSIFGIINYIQVKNTVVPLTKELSSEVLKARSAETGRLIKGYANVIKTMAHDERVREGSRDEIKAYLMSQTEDIDPDYEMFFYADVSGNYVATAGSEGNVADRDYFKAVMNNGFDAYISNPVVSRATGKHVFVVAHVVKTGQGERKGLIAATVMLKTLSEIVESIQLGENGFGYVVDNSGMLIAHPNDELRMNLNLLNSADMGFKDLDKVGQSMVRGEAGVLAYKRPDGAYFTTIFSPIPNTPGWVLGIALHEKDLMKAATHLTHNVIYLTATILALVVLIVTLVAKRIASPIAALKKGVRTIGSGNLDLRLDIHTGDEIEELADCFNKMTGDLKEYIANLKKTTAEKERIEGELKIANSIQSSMLPRIFPPYPNIKNLDLYATMEPARDVGGDFYDFFLTNDHNMCFCIGDVSGKGIPAALFMVISRTILKNLVLQGGSLDEVFFKANNMLCSDNDESMFVTLFMGIIDIHTGELEYISAGHNPPVISRSGNKYEFLQVDPSMVMGGMEDFEYHSRKTVITPDDMLFLYTDGVTEAMNQENELFSEERMLETLNQFVGNDTQSIIRGVRAEISRFIEDTPSSDDVTMLALALKSRK